MYIYNLSICIYISVYLPICYNHGTEKNQKLNSELNHNQFDE